VAPVADPPWRPRTDRRLFGVMTREIEMDDLELQ